MTDDDVNVLEPMMLASLARAIDFVKFGEAKNAALLTFTSAWILGSANVAVGDVTDVHPIVRPVLMIGVLLLVTGAFCALASFLPRTDLQKLKGKWHANPRTNHLFFGHLAVLKSDDLHTRFAELYLSAGRTGLNAQYLDDLGCQIVVNSKIAATKFLLFTLGVRATIAALLVYALAAVGVVVLS